MVTWKLGKSEVFSCKLKYKGCLLRTKYCKGKAFDLSYIKSPKFFTRVLLKICQEILDCFRNFYGSLYDMLAKSLKRTKKSTWRLFFFLHAEGLIKVFP